MLFKFTETRPFPNFRIPEFAEAGSAPKPLKARRAHAPESNARRLISGFSVI
jgi:hypothetical protein